MHPLLARQLDRLGLSPDAQPDAASWARLIGRIDAAYTQADQAREMVERSMTLSSREMQDLHDRLRVANDELEHKVRSRTDELQRLNESLRAEVDERRRTEAALAKSERWIRLVNDSLPVMLAYVDAGETYRYINEAYSTRLGVPRDAIVGQQVRDVVGESVYEIIRPHIATVLTGQVTSFERTQTTAAGTVHWFTGEFVPDIDDAGTVVGYYVMLVDVTAQKSAERIAQQNEMRFRGLTALSSDWYWEQDTELRFVASDALFDTTGSGDPIIESGLHPWELRGIAPPDDGWSAHRATLEAHQPFRDLVLKRTTDDDRIHFLSVSGEPVFDADGVFTGYRGIVKDITVLKQAEQDARTTREVLSTLLDAVPDPIFVKDEAHRFMLLNDAACAFIGQPREVLLGKGDHDFFPKALADDFWEKDNRVFASSADLVAEEQVTGADGVTRTLSTKKRAIRMLDGRQVLVGSIRDITELKEQQRQLSGAKEAAEAGSRAKSEFLARMSHEVRTPMNGVLGMTELLRATQLTSEQRGFVDTVHGSGVALLRIINDILDFSKVEAGKLELEQVDFVLADCVGNTVDLLRGRATAKGLAISVRVAADVPPAVRGDPSRLGQILTNLVGNAVKFTERGSIEVSVELAGHVDGDVVLRFEVADHGIGIAPAAQETIFDAFHQADGGTSRRYGGTGLGLAICRQLAHLLGGEIGVCSRPGEGSTFWFTVRLAVADAPAIHEGSALPTAGPDSTHVAAAPVPSTTRVLLAEDNAVNRHVALAMLRSLGFSADTAVDGREAVDATARVRYDVVLMDCHMPGMDGFSATAMIRERDALTGAPRVPIVALTANAMTGDREACIAGGMDDYLSKPFTRAQLQALLERWATSAATGTDTPQASAGA